MPPSIVLLSALEHHLSFTRQCALIHVDGVRVRGAHTVIGHRAHRRADSGAGPREHGRHILRAIPFSPIATRCPAGPAPFGPGPRCASLIASGIPSGSARCCRVRPGPRCAVGANTGPQGAPTRALPGSGPALVARRVGTCRGHGSPTRCQGSAPAFVARAWPSLRPADEPRVLPGLTPALAARGAAGRTPSPGRWRCRVRLRPSLRIPVPAAQRAAADRRCRGPGPHCAKVPALPSDPLKISLAGLGPGPRCAWSIVRIRLMLVMGFAGVRPRPSLRDQADDPPAVLMDGDVAGLCPGPHCAMIPQAFWQNLQIAGVAGVRVRPSLRAVREHAHRHGGHPRCRVRPRPSLRGAEAAAGHGGCSGVAGVRPGSRCASQSLP
jgi:hypothetical protein